MMGVFKHLIHLFALTFVIAFAGMIYIVQDDTTDDMGLEKRDIKQIEMLDFYISHHPVYYGLSKVS